MIRFQYMATTILFFAANAAWAERVLETNYLHIDPANAIVVNGLFNVSTMSPGPHRMGGVEIGRGFTVGPKGRLTIGPGQSARDSETIVLGFGEEICVVGVKVRVKPGLPPNGIKVTFSFIASDGGLVDQKTRWPARGTTLQSFSSVHYSDVSVR